MPHRSRKRCCTNATQRWRSWRCANLVAWFYQWGIAPIMAISYGKWSTIGLLDNDSALSRSTGIHGMVQLTSDHIIQNPWKFLVTLHCCRQINHITVLLVSSVATPFIHWGWYFHPFEENSLKLWNIQIVLVTFHITEQPKSCSGFRGIVRPVSKNYQNVLSKSVIPVTFHCNSKFRAFFEHQRSRFKDWNLQPLSIISQHLEYTHAHMLASSQGALHLAIHRISWLQYAAIGPVTGANCVAVGWCSIATGWDSGYQGLPRRMDSAAETDSWARL